MQIDGITFDDSLDFVSFVRDVMTNKSGIPERPDDPLPVAWLARTYPQLAGTPWVEKLSRAIAANITDSDPAVRNQALMFFEMHPTAPGSERVIELARKQSHLFYGTTNPEHPSVDLEWQLLTTLGRLVRKNVGDARDLARKVVLEPERAAPVIASLSSVDGDWVSQHAEEVLRATPAAASAMLINLELAGKEIVDVGTRIAPLVAHDRKFRDNLKLLNDNEARTKILAAMRTGTSVRNRSSHAFAAYESTDWLAFLRTAANRPAAAHALRDDLETPIALSALASDCEGTPLEEALADAALKLIESGTQIEMDTVRRLPYEKAPNAFNRLLRALETTPDRFAHEGWRESVFWKLFQVKPDDQHLRSALSRQLKATPDDAQLKDLAERYLS